MNGVMKRWTVGFIALVWTTAFALAQSQPEAAADAGSQPMSVVLAVSLPGTEPVQLSLPWEPGITALDLLRVGNLPHALAWFPSLGQYMVTGIMNHSPAEPEYWQLCVDGNPAAVGAGSYVLAVGARVDYKSAPGGC